MLAHPPRLASAALVHAQTHLICAPAPPSLTSPPQGTMPQLNDESRRLSLPSRASAAALAPAPAPVPGVVAGVGAGAGAGAGARAGAGAGAGAGHIVTSKAKRELVDEIKLRMTNMQVFAIPFQPNWVGHRNVQSALKGGQQGKAVEKR